MDAKRIVIEEAISAGINPDVALSLWKQESGQSTDIAMRGPVLPKGKWAGHYARGPWQIMSFHGPIPEDFRGQTQWAMKHLKERGLRGYYGTGSPVVEGHPTTDQYVAQVMGRVGKPVDVRMASAGEDTTAPMRGPTGDPRTGAMGLKAPDDMTLKEIEEELAMLEAPAPALRDPDQMSLAEIEAELAALGAEESAPVPAASLTAAPPLDVEPPSTLESFGRGVMDPVTALSQMARNAVPEGVRNAVDNADRWIGEKTGGIFAPLTQERLNAQEQEYQSRRGDGADWARMGGNVLAGLALTRGLPTPQTAMGAIGGGAAIGAGLGLTQPVTGQPAENFWAAKAQQAKTGAAFGAPAGLAGHAIGRIISPAASKDPGLRRLRDEGITPSVGQALGGMTNKMEQRVGSLPFVGDMIASRRSGAINDFNRAVINRAGKPIGFSTKKIGTEGVEDVASAISKAYERALAGIKEVKLDAPFVSTIRGILARNKDMLKPQRLRFQNYIAENFMGRSSSNKLTATAFKRIESELNTYAARYQRSAIAAEQELGDAFADLLMSVRTTAARQNPRYANELAKANRAYAELIRLQGAANRAVNTEGVFTPGQYNLSVRTADMSKHRSQTARGKALGQGIGQDAQRILGNTVPNSGTPERLLATAGIGYAIDPAIAASVALGAGLYTSPVQRALVYAATRRPDGANALADLVRKAGPVAVLPAMPGLNGKQ